MENEFSLSPCVKLSFISPENNSFWFGYYNYSPINYTETKLLAQKVEFDGRSINSNDFAEVGWFDLKTGEWNNIGKTNAFNWQQGSMLQWLGKSNSFIYNAAEDTNFISIIYNIDTKQERIIPYPIYGIPQSSDYSISLEFKRSYWCRAYHYESIRDEKYEGNVIEGDGVFFVDFKTNERKCIIPINKIIAIDPDPSFSEAKHWVEHIMLNPSGTRFAFYHRFQYVSGFTTRIFTAKINGSDLRIIDGWRANSWSHMGWLNDEQFVVYAQEKKESLETYKKITQQSGKLGKVLHTVYKKTIGRFLTPVVRRKIISTGCYQFYDCLSGKQYDEIGKSIFPLDGHPGFTSDGKFMLTDTYEDFDSYRYLYLYSLESKKAIELGRFYSPFNSCDYRSDLHPRFDFGEKSVIIDSAHSGYHRIVKLDLDWNLLNKEIKDEH